MSAWDDVVAAALLGTSRNVFTPPPADGALGTLLGGLDVNEQADLLLSTAAVLHLYQRAGQASRAAAFSPPVPPELDDLSTCTDRAGHDLGMMLAGEHEEVLSEWLAALAARRLRVPAQHLPDLFGKITKQTDVRDAAMRVVGARGRWLAAQNPDWHDLLDADESHWETSGGAQRLNLLRSLRASDPEHARELVVATWGAETAETRTKMLGELAIKLRMADEPFLETCLDDRSKEVRLDAAQLLARLPESRLCRRMIQRIRTLVIPQREGAKAFIGLLKSRNDKRFVDVTLPDVCTDAMQRDGVVVKPFVNDKIGERAWWLRQMIACVPLSYWRTAFDATPAHIVQTLEQKGREGDWNTLLLDGITLATCRQGDAAWAAALLASSWVIEANDTTGARWRDELLTLLPAAQWEAAVLRLYEDSIANPLTTIGFSRTYDQLCKRPWSYEVSRAFFRFVVSYKAAREKAKRNAYSLWWLLGAVKQAATCIPTSLLHETAAALPSDEEDSLWTDARQQCLTLLQFRHDMLEEIAR
jgi:hypothetical protein